MGRWFRRRSRQQHTSSGPTLGPDGTYYDRPWKAAAQGARRGWLAWLGRVVAAPFRAVGAVGKRAITSLPWVQGGPRPSVVSAERAISLVPLFACVRILADNIASLPLQTYQRLGDRRVPQSYVPQLLFAPAARDDLFQWLHKLVVSLALRGNAYGLIVARDDFGFPTMIEWLHPDEVWVDETKPTLPVYRWLGAEIPREDVFHVPWMVMPGRVVGLSPVQAFAKTIGVGLAATEYGRSWFDNGGTPPATMKNTQKTVSTEESNAIRERLTNAIRTRQPLVFGADWDFTALKVNPEESQFIETMRLTATQIAAIYGLPPERVGGEAGGSLTYNTVELNALAEVAALRPWLVRIENRISALLPPRKFVKFNVDAMIRTDTLTRYRAHQIAITSGWRNADETRAIEDEAPLPNGAGKVYKPVATVPEPAKDPDETREGGPRG